MFTSALGVPMKSSNYIRAILLITIVAFQGIAGAESAKPSDYKKCFEATKNNSLRLSLSDTTDSDPFLVPGTSPFNGQTVPGVFLLTDSSAFFVPDRPSPTLVAGEAEKKDSCAVYKNSAVLGAYEKCVTDKAIKDAKKLETASDAADPCASYKNSAVLGEYERCVTNRAVKEAKKLEAASDIKDPCASYKNSVVLGAYEKCVTDKAIKDAKKLEAISDAKDPCASYKNSAVLGEYDRCFIARMKAGGKRPEPSFFSECEEYKGSALLGAYDQCVQKKIDRLSSDKIAPTQVTIENGSNNSYLIYHVLGGYRIRKVSAADPNLDRLPGLKKASLGTEDIPDAWTIATRSSFEASLTQALVKAAGLNKKDKKFKICGVIPNSEIRALAAQLSESADRIRFGGTLDAPKEEGAAEKKLDLLIK
jgi:hypothetical protein